MKRGTKLILVFVVLIVAAVGSIPLFVNANTSHHGKKPCEFVGVVCFGSNPLHFGELDEF